MAAASFPIALDRLRRGAAALLESGEVPASALTRAMAGVWDAGARRHLRRSLPSPAGVQIVGIGSACLGGAGKTPLCIALARAWAARGSRAVIVGHGYRAWSRRAGVVGPHDDVRIVGDDALACARATADVGGVVVSGPRRSDSIDLAARDGGEILLLDGVLQARPRLGWSLLVLDAGVGFGRGLPPPLGDLRGKPDTLGAACDVVVVLRDRCAPQSLPEVPLDRPTVVLDTDLEGVVGPDEKRLGLEHLQGLRVGTILGIAHPERVKAALEARGVHPAWSIELGDHPRLDARALERIVSERVGRGGVKPDLLLATARCAVNLPSTLGGIQVGALVHTVDPGPLLSLAPWR